MLNVRPTWFIYIIYTGYEPIRSVIVHTILMVVKHARNNSAESTKSFVISSNLIIHHFDKTHNSFKIMVLNTTFLRFLVVEKMGKRRFHYAFPIALF